MAQAREQSLGAKRGRCCASQRVKVLLLCGCCLVPVILVALACVIGYFFVREGAGGPLWADGELLTPENMTLFLPWPGCEEGWKGREELGRCARPCYTADLLLAMDTFNRAHGFKLVSFDSRPGSDGAEPVRLSAWWLPPPAESAGMEPAPRVVLLHGFGGNFNDWSVQLAAYYLRSAGFGVLVPNLRNHGLSDHAGSGLCSWGWTYAFDLLGAWDYARADPESLLGGALPADRVGIMGFSMGGFVTSTALGLEPLVPAAWVDSGVFDPKDVLRYLIRDHLGPLVWLTYNLAWWSAESFAAVPDLDRYIPARTLPTGPARQRPVALVRNLQDTLVRPSQTKRLRGVLSMEPARYRVGEDIIVNAECQGETHLVAELLQPGPYALRLCSFWGEALGRGNASCAAAAGALAAAAGAAPPRAAGAAAAPA